MTRRSKPNSGRDLTRARSALSRASWTIEDRLVWGGADLARGAFELIRWPFERAAWAFERGLVWPLQKRTGDWNEALRIGGAMGLALLAVAAGVLGLILAAGSGGGGTMVARVSESTTLTAPPAQQAPPQKPAQAAPVLHGGPPDFAAETGVGAAKATGTPTPAGTGADGADQAAATDSSATSAAAAAPGLATASTETKIVAAGPGATKVAHRFAAAFVDFETGQVDGEVRTAFAATATPQLSRSLLHRPPRLPANVKVPKAKVLNVVPGPKHGDTYALSVSLLRVGVTSELRIDMERDPQSAEWRVTDVRG